MSIKKIYIEEFVSLAQFLPILDVRSPGEFNHAHIPNAISLPLFTDEERKIVGTAYKQESREKAIKIGLDFFGKKMVPLVESVEKIIAEKKGGSRGVVLHCWRGGMRSASVAWLLDLYGFEVYLLLGGYKGYRNWVLKQFEKEYHLQIVSGYTGSNKTGIIHAMLGCGENSIDLEGLASHKGSAFGNLQMSPQPSQEQFENLLAQELHAINIKTIDAPIWIEDESQRIGNVNIPSSFFKKMREQPILFIDIPFEERLLHLVAEYGKFEKEKLINAILRIKKKLGGLETKNAVNFLLEDDIKNCFAVLLNYYDRNYLKSCQKRENFEDNVTTITCPSTEAITNTKKLIDYVRNQK